MGFDLLKNIFRFELFNCLLFIIILLTKLLGVHNTILETMYEVLPSTKGLRFLYDMNRRLSKAVSLTSST